MTEVTARAIAAAFNNGTLEAQAESREKLAGLSEPQQEELLGMLSEFVARPKPEQERLLAAFSVEPGALTTLSEQTPEQQQASLTFIGEFVAAVNALPDQEPKTFVDLAGRLATLSPEGQTEMVAQLAGKPRSDEHSAAAVSARAASLQQNAERTAKPTTTVGSAESEAVRHQRQPQENGPGQRATGLGRD